MNPHLCISTDGCLYLIYVLFIQVQVLQQWNQSNKNTKTSPAAPRQTHLHHQNFDNLSSSAVKEKKKNINNLTSTVLILTITVSIISKAESVFQSSPRRSFSSRFTVCNSPNNMESTRCLDSVGLTGSYKAQTGITWLQYNNTSFQEVPSFHDPGSRLKTFGLGL